MIKEAIFRVARFPVGRANREAFSAPLRQLARDHGAIVRERSNRAADHGSRPPSPATLVGGVPLERVGSRSRIMRLGGGAPATRCLPKVAIDTTIAAR